MNGQLSYHLSGADEREQGWPKLKVPPGEPATKTEDSSIDGEEHLGASEMAAEWEGSG